MEIVVAQVKNLWENFAMQVDVEKNERSEEG